MANEGSLRGLGPQFLILNLIATAISLTILSLAHSLDSAPEPDDILRYVAKRAELHRVQKDMYYLGTLACQNTRERIEGMFDDCRVLLSYKILPDELVLYAHHQESGSGLPTLDSIFDLPALSVPATHRSLPRKDRDGWWGGDEATR